MTLDSQLELCAEHYKKWKAAALESKDPQEIRKALDKAFFWIELHSAFIALNAVEQLNSKNPYAKNKILIAKTTLSKKLADYASEILNEINLS